MPMKNSSACIEYLDEQELQYIHQYPQNVVMTGELFSKAKEFIDTNYDGISENKIYRCFIDFLKELVTAVLKSDVSKAYIQSFFKTLNNKYVINCLINFMRSKESDIINTMNKLNKLFVYWQNSDHEKHDKSEEIISWLDKCK